VEGSDPSETKDKTVHRVGALITFGTFAHIDLYRRMTVIRLDRLASYHGAARDERP
jgi:hypothetical protein